jgi:7-cyano-7-deazaguanine synthase
MSLKTVLLLSGGLDSSSIASATRPDVTLFVDYGQRPAQAEAAASRRVAGHLGLRWERLALDLSPFAAGAIGGARAIPETSTPEWFPFRNQFLTTAAAAFAVCGGYDIVFVGTVAGDGERHVDGTAEFIERLDEIIRMQEGSIKVTAPFRDVDPVDVLERGGLPDHILRRTYSCHTGNLACGRCAGCLRRTQLLSHR